MRLPFSEHNADIFALINTLARVTDAGYGQHIYRDQRVYAGADVNKCAEFFKMGDPRVDDIPFVQIVYKILFAAKLHGFTGKNGAYVAAVIPLKSEYNKAHGLVDL